jgi:hypothetical protein
MAKRSCFINGGMSRAMVLTKAEFICNDSRAPNQLSLAQERPSGYRLTVSGRLHCSPQDRNRVSSYCQLRRANRDPLPNPNQGILLRVIFPDGKQILFTGLEARAEAVIRSFVQDVNTGQVHPLTEEGTTALRISPDGKRVITLQPDENFYIQVWMAENQRKFRDLNVMMNLFSGAMVLGRYS